MELIDLVNSAMIFLSQMTLTQMVSFPTWSLTVALTFLLFRISFSLPALVFVPQWLSHHWNIPSIGIYMCLSQFPITFRQTQKGMPCFIALIMTILVLIAVISKIIWEMFHGRISLNLVLLLLLVNFVIRFMLELMYISLIVNICSSLTHLHGIHLILLLPCSS